MQCRRAKTYSKALKRSVKSESKRLLTDDVTDNTVTTAASVSFKLALPKDMLSRSFYVFRNKIMAKLI